MSNPKTDQNQKQIRKLGFNKILEIYKTTLPKIFVEKLGWKSGDNLTYTVQGDNLIIHREF